MLLGGVLNSVFSDVAASLVLVAGGFLVGRYRERRRMKGRDLTEYDFYPYTRTPENFAEFSLKDFRLGMHHFLRNSDPRAARQLIFIGEQNNVRHALGEADAASYDRLLAKYQGAHIASDAQDFLENYRNIARLFGRTFQNMGIEVLIHDLSNPTHSIVTIESGEVTGRTQGMGTTSLLVDLMRRVNLKQDKLNYELNIGARRFKCTTVPIQRKEFGVVGAICINIDINYIRDHVLSSPERIAEFLQNYCRTDMVLDENILSKEEYKRALAGKTHFRDFRVQAA
ncbi:MAG TPA: PAS domain-containing protein [Rhizomicrobium sp.]|nr:PAS domain-containing protein [Rhizomicrobium sp.]